MLEGKNKQELTEIRNSVVKHLSDKSSEARAVRNWTLYDKYHNNMSGIVCVIDEMIFQMPRDFEVSWKYSC